MNKPFISIIVPVYNEADAVTPLVMKIDAACKKAKMTYEVIFIDDHSTDGTAEKLSALSKSYPVTPFLKKGKKGKAFSLIEGFSYAKADAIAMIDADLQYPPEAIPEMAMLLKTADVVVSERKKYQDTLLRRFISRSFRTIFGKGLFRLNHDIQSGLKVFKKVVIQTIPVTPRGAWAFDLEFLHRANHAGFKIVNFPITFAGRTDGKSKLKIVRTAKEIGLNALSVRMKRIQPQPLFREDTRTMLHAGFGFKKKQYVTHSTLPHQKSAIQTFHLSQKIMYILSILVVITGLVLYPLTTLKILIATLSVVYFIDVLFNLYIILKSLHNPQEIQVSEKELSRINDKELPVYTILCPMYKESHIIPQFIESISKLDWPKEKLDVLLLLEEDDIESIVSAQKKKLPPFIRVAVVPTSFPKTKPKACNYGLQFAKGEYLVIYDAEDVPDPLQLKKAYLAFAKSPKNVLCLQAKLNYFNPNQNLLTRFFTAEYSLWFDITLTGLQSMDTTIPLGGTSNHFRTADLLRLQGWDPFNVTEDADLGIRLFKEGYKTAIIDSTTLEEANSRVRNWIRQRSRWIKGYMQTYLVHTRLRSNFKNQNKIHALLFRLTIGGKIAFILINPILWLATIAYFAAYAYVGPTIESLYPSYVFYMALFSLVFGNFMFLYYFMIGAAKREQYGLIKYVFLIPLYWLLISIAGFMALQQLIFKPHYWEKTVHGFHLLPKKVKKPLNVAAAAPAPEPAQVKPVTTARPSFGVSLKKLYVSGGALVIAASIANLINFAFNSYLGRTIDFKYLAIVNLMGSFLYLINIPNDALSSTVKYRSGFLAGRYGASSAYEFWKRIRFKTFAASVAVTGLWILASFYLKQYFHTADIYPFVFFAPFFATAFIRTVDGSYLSGKLLFGSIALLVIYEPVVKFVLSYILVDSHNQAYAYTAIPLASVLTFFLGWVLVKIHKDTAAHTATVHDVTYFPKKYFAASLLSGLSTMMYLSLDVILATHFLPAKEAGEYALLSLSGKMIYFLGSLASQFVTPIISRNEGANKNSRAALNWILLGTAALAAIGFFAFGLFGSISLPILFGNRAKAITDFAPYFGFAMFCFTISRIYISYYLIKKIYTFSLVSLSIATLQLYLITQSHKTLGDIVFAMFVVGGLHAITSIILHLNIRRVKIFEDAVVDFFGLFRPSENTLQTEKLRILIFNWRDTHHKWAGGAEVYIHEIAKRLVKDGNAVTIFCGNDGESPKEQVVDGIEIQRRGGTFLVYVWAVLYYACKFRGKYDVIIDCENGIPFFTPLFSRKDIFLVVHHVHQEVFREHLRFPLSLIAGRLEGWLMPLVYRNKQIITVSESSKKAILRLGFSKPSNVHIVHNGIRSELFTPGEKTAYPLFTYLGRLKPYKNVDIAIKAFATISANYPEANLAIVGEGEFKNRLEKLVTELSIEKKVTFYGKVTEKKKAEILAKSWVVLQPSMTEGWGITVIEANASGTPVIASNVSGLKDSVVDNETGILVRVRDIEEFVTAMTDVISNKRYRNYLSKNAYTWSQNFNWDKSTAKFFQIIAAKTKKRSLFLAERFAFAK